MNVPVAELLTAPLVVVATLKGMEMVEPGSMLVLLTWDWKRDDRGGI